MDREIKRLPEVESREFDQLRRLVLWKHNDWTQDGNTIFNLNGEPILSVFPVEQYDWGGEDEEENLEFIMAARYYFDQSIMKIQELYWANKNLRRKCHEQTFALFMLMALIAGLFYLFIKQY